MLHVLLSLYFGSILYLKESFGYLGIWTFGHLGFWASGLLGIWAFGYLGFWASRHLGIWAFGHLGKIALFDRNMNFCWLSHFQ